MEIPIFLILLAWPLTPCVTLRIRGTFRTREFFHFLAKFGFQKTEIQTREQGFIYGNVTSNRMPDIGVTLAVLDRGYFLEYYGNRSVFDKVKACRRMFKKINEVTYDASCYDDGEQDFIRTIPCPRNELCSEEDNSANVVPGYQLTYRIQDYAQSRFWYVSMVACHRNKTTCEWEPVREELDIQYDLWLVNGNPTNPNRNILKYQYSCDTQDLMGVSLFLLLVYTILTPVQFYASYQQNHNIAKFLAAGILTEFLALVSASLHHCLFSWNGVGLPSFEIIGELLEICSQTLFMLLLLLLGMGWAITRQELKCKFALSSLWILYTFVHCLLYIWKKYEVDVIEDVDEYQTIPGGIVLVLRVVVMFCFLLALKETMGHEFNEERLHFLLHFGAASLVWFIYLPVVAVVASQISPLWRTKFLTGISYSADTFGYIVLVHLLWPSRSRQYFLLASQVDHSEELEELSEAPNQIHAKNDAFSSTEDILISADA